MLHVVWFAINLLDSCLRWFLCRPSIAWPFAYYYMLQVIMFIHKHVPHCMHFGQILLKNNNRKHATIMHKDIWGRIFPYDSKYIVKKNNGKHKCVIMIMMGSRFRCAPDDTHRRRLRNVHRVWWVYSKSHVCYAIPKFVKCTRRMPKCNGAFTHPHLSVQEHLISHLVDGVLLIVCVEDERAECARCRIYNFHISAYSHYRWDVCMASPLLEMCQNNSH